jgi:RND family efflux transporter MFP subunit
LVRARQRGGEAAQGALDAVRKLESYLQVRAPFSGVITDRMAHPGALVGPNTEPLVRLEQVARLRLVLPVPESAVGGIRPRQRITFTAPAYPGTKFPAAVARIAHAVDPKTRTMPVELDVPNANNKLAPGMYCEATLPVQSAAAVLVPPTAVVTTTERTFVIRVNNNRAEWVNVRRGTAAGDLVEVYGPLSAGDIILKRGSDEIREGTRLQIARHS